MSTHNGIISMGLKNEFETAMVNEPSVFEPLKVYCNGTLYVLIRIASMNIQHTIMLEKIKKISLLCSGAMKNTH